jgi:hypothetical protein
MDNNNSTTTTTTTTPMTDRIRAEAAHCLRAARAEGFDGLDSEFELTKYDIEYMLNVLGRKPSREEWNDAGLPGMGSQYCSAQDNE